MQSFLHFGIKYPIEQQNCKSKDQYSNNNFGAGKAGQIFNLLMITTNSIDHLS